MSFLRIGLIRENRRVLNRSPLPSIDVLSFSQQKMMCFPRLRSILFSEGEEKSPGRERSRAPPSGSEDGASVTGLRDVSSRTDTEGRGAAWSSGEKDRGRNRRPGNDFSGAQKWSRSLGHLLFSLTAFSLRSMTKPDTTR